MYVNGSWADLAPTHSAMLPVHTLLVCVHSHFKSSLVVAIQNGCTVTVLDPYYMSNCVIAIQVVTQF